MLGKVTWEEVKKSLIDTIRDTSYNNFWLFSPVQKYLYLPEPNDHNFLQYDTTNIAFFAGLVTNFDIDTNDINSSPWCNELVCTHPMQEFCCKLVCTYPKQESCCIMYHWKAQFWFHLLVEIFFKNAISKRW